MQCENCGNDAAIQLTKVVDDEMKVLQLCTACAAEQGVDTGSPAPNAPLVDFLAQIGKTVDEGPDTGGCPACGMTQGQLKQGGRLGCAVCYSHFEQHLRSLLRRLHGGTQHVGKITATPDAEDVDRTARVHRLRRSLEHAIEAEDFEHAAALRDQIRRLETAS